MCHAIPFAGARIDNEARDTIASLKRNTNSASREYRVLPSSRPRPSPPPPSPPGSFNPFLYTGLTLPRRFNPDTNGRPARLSPRVRSNHLLLRGVSSAGGGWEGLLTSSRKWQSHNSAERRTTSAISKDILKHFFPSQRNLPGEATPRAFYRFLSICHVRSLPFLGFA